MKLQIMSDLHADVAFIKSVLVSHNINGLTESVSLAGCVPCHSLRANRTVCRTSTGGQSPPAKEFGACRASAACAPVPSTSSHTRDRLGHGGR
jgi:hypothetical protein